MIKAYIKEDKSGANMQALYDLQEMLYTNYGIYNYIFLVDYIDEKLEDLEKCAMTLIKSLSRKFGSSQSNTLIVLFSINSKRIRIQPGSNLDAKLSETDSEQMIQNLGTYMRKTDYYGAMEKLLKDIEYYYNHDSPSSSSSNELSAGTIILIIVIIIGIIACCILCRKMGCEMSSSSSLFDNSYHTHGHHHHTSRSNHKSSGRSGGHKSSGGGGRSKGGASGGW